MSGLLNFPRCQKFVKKVLHTILLFAVAFMLSGTLKAQNNALQFDGADDYVNLGTLSPAGNFSTGFTFMGWIKWSSFNNWGTIIDLNNGVPDTYYANPNRILISTYGTGNALYVQFGNTATVSSYCLPQNEWVHIAITMNESGHAEIYANGGSVASLNTGALADVARTYCSLGDQATTWTPSLNAAMDEISFWSRALSITEINEKMHTQLAGNESGLYVYYPFNQGIADGDNTGVNVLTDYSINGKNSTLNNFALAGTASNWTSGSLSAFSPNKNAISLDGINDFVNLGTVSPTGNFSTGFTYMGWVKWGSFNNWARLFDSGTGAGNNNIMIASNATTNKLTLANYIGTTPSELTTANILSLNQWTHVAATISNTGAAKIYINGVLSASGNVGIPVNIARTLTYMGKSNWAADSYLNASIDEVSIWSRALSVSEIQASMTSSLTLSESGLYTYYMCNQGTPAATNTGLTTLFDATNNRKNGILTNLSLTGTTSNWVSGPVPAPIQKNALSFDGINDYVSVPALGSNLPQLTIETWFNSSAFASANNLNSIFNSNSWVNGDVHFQFINNSGTLQVQFAVLNSTTVSVTYPFATNTWYHLAVTYNASTKKVNIYVNGTLFQSITLTASVNANLTAAQIGAWTTSRYFSGKFDEFRIWNTERTAANIADNIFASLNGSESGLLANYNFNQGNAGATNSSVTSLNNGVGTNHGTLNNFALTGAASNWVAGIKNRPDNHAIGFNGSVVSSLMTLKWTDAVSNVNPDGYYIFASNENVFTDPADGTEPAIDNDLTDGKGVVKVLYGAQLFNNWINDELYTPYYFKIYPYSNSGQSILYNKTGTVPQIQLTSAGQFSLQNGISFPSLTRSRIESGDYDNDGKPDLILIGDSAGVAISRIFKGDGAGGFAPQYQIKLKGVERGSVAWGDYNNDGYLDFILTGSPRYAYPPTGFTAIYKNNKNGTFTEQTQIELFPISLGEAVWGDYDNDGDLDIFLAGKGVAKIYRNNGDNSFTDYLSLPGVTYGAPAWCDYDNDGFLDLVYSGIGTDSNVKTRLYKNNSGKSFTYQPNSGLENMLGKLACGDFNNDKLPDLIMSNYDKTIIYRNTGNNSFIQQFVLPTVTEEGSISLADYDNDLFLDILTASYDNYYNASGKIFRNNHDNTFTEVTPQSWPTFWGGVAWADYDNDKRMDILVGGESGSFTGIYHNNIKTYNQEPATPVSLTVTKQTGSAKLSWIYPENAKQARFNLRIGKSSGAQDVFTSQSLASGTRLLPGNIKLINDTSFTLAPIKVGKYYWSVQAVDANGKGSSFAPEQNFTIDSIQSSKLVSTNINTTSLKLKWLRGNGDGCIVFCKANKSTISHPENDVIYKHSSMYGEGSRIAGTDWFCVYNGQADSVLVTGLNPGLVYTFHVMEYSTVNGKDKYLRQEVEDNIGFFSPSLFTDLQNLATEEVRYGSLAWGDYDNDGFLDILAAGVLVENSFYAKVYRNNGDNTFTPQSFFSILLPDDPNNRFNSNFSGYWADFDNDGFLDIFIVDAYNNGTAKIYHNNHELSGTTFTLMYDFGVNNAAGSYEDLNNDGYLDIVLTGKIDTRIYGNNKDLTFTLKNTIPFNVYNGSLACADYNNDGLSDILLTGYHKVAEYNLVPATNLYKNNGDWTFTENTDNTLLDISYGFGQFTDYDNDGFQDIFLSGVGANWNPGQTMLYHNSGDGTFTANTNSGIGSFDYSGADWGDYNNDGYADLIITGNNGGTVTRIYRNNKNGTFSEDTGITLTGSYRGTAKWCDYDSDGDLDVLISGGSNMIIYQNTTTSQAGIQKKNIKPSVPGNLQSLVTPNKVTLSWLPVQNDETPAISMSYNLRFRTAGSTDWKSAPKSVDTMRLVNSAGNVHLTTSISMSNLPVGQYEWSVQAVDQGYKAGFWSPNKTFEVRDLQTFFNSETVCLGLPTNFTDQSVSTDGITAWKWDFNDGITSTVQNPVHTFSSSGSFNVKLVITSTSGAKDSLINIVTVKPKPLTGFTSPATCLGSAATITNTTNINGLTISSWNWSFGDDLFSSDQQPSAHPYLLAKDYLVKLKAIASNGCADSVTNIVTVGSIPIALVTANAPLAFCKGDSVTLSVPYNTNFLYNWKNDGTSITGADSSGYTAKLSGTYSVEVVNTKGNCPANSLPVSVTVRNAPEAPVIITEGALQFCQGDSVKLSVTAIPGYEYNWKLNGGAVGLKSNQHFATVTGKYHLMVSNSNGCSVSSSDSIDIVSKPSPVLSSIAPNGPTKFCQGGNVELSVPANASYTYQWQNSGANISTATSNSYSAISSGVYSLLISNSNGCTGKTESITVNVLTVPIVSSISVTGTTAFCQGDSVKLSVTAVAGYEYNWKLNGGAVGLKSNQYYAKNSGKYNLIVSNSNGCSVESANEVDVLVKQTPVLSSISRSGDLQFCEGGSVLLSVPSVQGNLYNWKNENGPVIGETSNSYTANKSGSYSLEISNSAGCAVNTPSVSVVVRKMPAKPVLLTDNYTPGECLGKNPVRLSASEQVTGYSYQWFKNTSPIPNATSSLLEGFLAQGEYRLTAELNSCSVQSDAVTIAFDDAPAKPVINAYGPTIWYLTCSDTSATKYMWYYNGSLVEENGKQNYVAFQKLGVYNVSVANAKGCYTMSDAITIPTGTVGVEETNIFDEMIIYPNPTSGLFNIVVDNQHYGEMLISILDQGGKTVTNMKSEKTTAFHSIPVDLSSFSKGIYFVTIRSGKLSINKKIILK